MEFRVWLEQQYQYMGQCDKVRCQSGQNEVYWQQMMSQKSPVSFDEFMSSVDLSSLLDEDESPEEYMQGHANDPSLGFYKSMWGNTPCYFFQSHGFEFIFTN